MSEPSIQQSEEVQISPAKLQPSQPSPRVQPALQQPPRDSKKALIVIASIVGFFVIVGIVLAVIMAVFAVSKKDYQAALTQYNKIARADRQLKTEITTMSYGIRYASNAIYSKSTEEARRSIKEVSDENTELSKLKAVRSGEGKKLYRLFSDKVSGYTKYNESVVTSLNDARTSLTACNTAASGSSSAESAKKAADTCVAELKKVKDTPNVDIRNFLGSYQTQMEKLSLLAGQLAAITDPYGTQRSQYLSLRRQVLAVQGTVSTASVKLKKDIDTHGKDVSPKEAAKKLSDFLAEKSR